MPASDNVLHHELALDAAGSCMWEACALMWSFTILNGVLCGKGTALRKKLSALSVSLLLFACTDLGKKGEVKEVSKEVKIVCVHIHKRGKAHMHKDRSGLQNKLF